jgi:hypothetical protein
MSEEERLAELFRMYREACPDPEPGADFMPGLWARIEGRRRSALTLRRWTGAFLAAAMALSLVMTVHSLRQADPGLHPFSYVEVLGADEPFETFAYEDIAHLEIPPNPELR